LSVYAESTFSPKLDKFDFLQEGWRFDFEEEGNPESKLKYKGVVYNEMKGVYENPRSIFMERMQNELLKGTIYGNNSGGDPPAIPELTHQQLKDFHQKNYHPSNSSIFSYGDLNPLEHQKFLEENYLSKMERIEITESVGVPTISEPTHITHYKPPNTQVIEEGKSTSFGIGFICDEIGLKSEDSLALSILSYLMFDTPSSPFYVRFLEEGLASGYCAGKGYEPVLQYATFTIGFEDIEDNSVEAIEAKIFKTLELIVEEGFDEGAFEGAIHLIESSNRIANNNFGINLFMRLLGGINHEQDHVISKSLDVTDSVKTLRSQFESGYFEKLISKYFLNNERRVHLTLKSQDNYLEELGEVESEKLAEIQSNLTQEKID
jgi:Zn-dependent M16 (insulinase) family peptidase